MRIDVVTPAGLSWADRAAWRGFQAASPYLASPFLSPDWLDAVEASGGPDAGRIRIAVRREAGRPVAFLPVRAGRFVARAVGAPFNDAQGLVAAPGAALDLRAALAALGLPRLDFQNLDERQVGLGRFVRGRAAAWSVDLSQGFEAYAEGRRAAGSRTLRDCAKKERMLDREVGPVSFTALSGDQAAFDQLFAWKRAQLAATRQTDVLARGWTMALMRRLFEAPGETCGGALFTLHAGGRLVAAHYALRGPGVLHAWIIAHDRAYARYSPGAVLIAEVLRWAAAEGIGRLELGPGDYRFKTSFANTRREIGHGFVGRPSAASLVRRAEYGLRAAAEALPLGPVSTLPGKVMRRLDILSALS